MPLPTNLHTCQTLQAHISLEVNLVKVIFLTMTETLAPLTRISNLSHNKIQEMCGSCNLKVHDYCENCYGLFPDDKDIYSGRQLIEQGK